MTILERRLKKKSEETGNNIQYFDNFDVSFRIFWRDFEESIKNILNEVKLAHPDNSLDDYSNHKNANSIVKSIQELSDYVVNIPRIETKINELFRQFESFESRLTPALRENGLLKNQPTYPSGDEERNPSRTSLNRLKNIVASIEEMGLLDDNTLQELRSALEDLA